MSPDSINRSTADQWRGFARELQPLVADQPRQKQAQHPWARTLLSPDSGSLRPVMVGVLTFLCSMNMVCLTASKRAAGQFKFEYVTVTLLQECCKLCIAFVGLQLELACYSSLSERSGMRQEMYDSVFSGTRFLQYGIPGLIYCFDNNFQYVILQFLQPAELAILWNFKIFATTLLLHTFLNRRYSQQQWIAMVLLVLGCAGTQASDFLSQHSDVAHMLRLSAMSGGGVGNGEQQQQQQVLADELDDTAPPSKLVGVGLAVFGSSVAASGNVVCEWLVKKRAKESMHVQNMQLYCFGILFNLVTLALKAVTEPESPIYGKDGFFTGFNRWVYTVIALGSCAGIAVSVTLKFVDNIAVIFSHALAMIAVAVISSQFFDLQLSFSFVGGGLLVLMSLYMFYSASETESAENIGNGSKELGGKPILGVDLHEQHRSFGDSAAVPMYCLEGNRI